MKNKPDPRYATPEELASFAALQIRASLRQQAEIGALREVIITQLAETLAPEKKAEFITRISSELERCSREIYQRLLERAEDVDPATAALLDSRDDAEIPPAP